MRLLLIMSFLALSVATGCIVGSDSGERSSGENLDFEVVHSSMNIIQGTLTVNGRPRNGVTAKLWRAEAFSSPPAQGDALPDDQYQVGSEVTTGPDHGSDGAYRFVNLEDGYYYVSLEVGGTIAWEGHTVHSEVENYKARSQVHENAVVEAGQTVTIAHAYGSGIVRQIWMAITAETKDVLEADTRLKVYVNGQGTPSVNAPLSHFFAYFHEAEPFAAEQLAVSHKNYDDATPVYERGMYRYLDIPFDSQIRITVDNAPGDFRIWSKVFYHETDTKINRGRESHLRTVYNEDLALDPYQPIDLVNITGRGRLNDMVLSIFNGDGAQILESDLEIYVDGEQVPSVYSPGTEDIPGGAFYWGGQPQIGPYQGASFVDLGPPTRVTLYRFFEQDKLDFDSSLRIRWYAGHEGQGPGAITETTAIRAAISYYVDSQPQQVEQGSLELLVQDSFDSYGEGNDIGGPWVQIGGADQWKQSGDSAVYTDTSEGDAWMYHSDTDQWNDQIVEADVVINNFGTGEVWLFARGTASPFFADRVTFGFSALGTFPSHPPYQQIMLFIGSTVFSEASLTLAPQDVVHTLRLEVSGGEVIGSIKRKSEENFKELFRHVQSARLEGFSGVSVSSGDVEVEEFRVYRRP